MVLSKVDKNLMSEKVSNEEILARAIISRKTVVTNLKTQFEV